MRGMGGIARGARRMFRGGSRGGSAPSSEYVFFLTLWFVDLRKSSFSSQSQRRELDDELLEREYDEELFEREPEPLFGFIKKWFNKKKT